VAMPFYVSPEQLMKDRADFARKGIARGRSVVVPVRRRVLFVAENPSRRAAQGQRDLRPHRVRRGGQVQRVREPARRRRPAGRPARVLLRPTRRHGSGPGQRLRADPRRDLHHRRPSPTRWRSASPRSAPTPEPDQIYRLTYDGSVPTSTASPSWAGTSEPSVAPVWRAYRPGHDLWPRCGWRCDGLASDGGTGGSARCRRRSWRSPCSTGAAPAHVPPHPAPPSSTRLPESGRGQPQRGLTSARAPGTCPMTHRRRRPVPCSSWTGASSGSRPSTGSPAPSAGSGGCPGRGGPLPVPPGGVLGPLQQRLPAQRRPALPRRRQPPGVRHARVRLGAATGHPRQGGGADPRGPARRRRAADADEGIAGDVYLFKNNTDSAGNSYGCHENYLIGPARRVRPAGRRADPVPGVPADHLRRRQGAADPARCGVLPASAPSTSGKACRRRHDPVPADHQHPRRAARRRRALPPAARHRRRLQHERDHHPAQGRRGRPGAADGRVGRGHARPDAWRTRSGPSGRSATTSPAAARSAWPTAGGQRAGDPAGVLLQGRGTSWSARAATRSTSARSTCGSGP
jgi:proteasome alpha subunit